MKVSHVLIYRRLLVGIIVVLLVAVCFNYLQSWRRRNSQVQQTPDILSGELSRSVEGIEYTERRHGQVQFKLKAARLRETRGGQAWQSPPRCALASRSTEAPARRLSSVAG